MQQRKTQGSADKNTLCPEVNEVMTPAGHFCPQYNTVQSDNISWVGCSCKPVTTTVSDITELDSNREYDQLRKAVLLGNPNLIELNSSFISNINYFAGEGLIFMPQIQFGTKHRNGYSAVQLETFSEQQMFSLSGSMRHLVGLNCRESIVHLN